MKQSSIWLAGLCVIMAIAGCKHKKSNTEIFKESYLKNLQECIAVAMQTNADSSLAAQRCSCMINTAFSIDSTIVSMEPFAFRKFIQENQDFLIDACNENLSIEDSN